MQAEKQAVQRAAMLAERQAELEAERKLYAARLAGELLWDELQLGFN